MQISTIAITTTLDTVNLDMNAGSHTIMNCVKNKSVEKKMCRSRHPKSCKFGMNCKFFKRHVCIYKHIDKKIDASENLAKEIKDLEKDVKNLEGEIKILKRCIESKEIQL